MIIYEKKNAKTHRIQVAQCTCVHVADVAVDEDTCPGVRSIAPEGSTPHNSHRRGRRLPHPLPPRRPRQPCWRLTVHGMQAPAPHPSNKPTHHARLRLKQS